MRSRRDAWIAAAGFVVLWAWDHSRGDLGVARWFGDAQGFPWRDAWITSTLLHDGARIAGWLLLAALGLDAARAPPDAVPSPAMRWYWLAVTVACLAAVPMAKHFSTTSCPWELYQFGGMARLVPHWALGQADGGSGQCFPSGHAAAAAAFGTRWFLWRADQPRRARRWLWGVGGATLLLGGAQVVRGAHFPSHVGWTAWLCWCLCSAASAAAEVARQRRPAIALPSNPD